MRTSEGQLQFERIEPPLDVIRLGFDLAEHLRIVFGDLGEANQIVGLLPEAPPGFDPRPEVAHAPGDRLRLGEIVPKAFFRAAPFEVGYLALIIGEVKDAPRDFPLARRSRPNAG
jgi:hypothetical protein